MGCLLCVLSYCTRGWQDFVSDIEIPHLGLKWMVDSSSILGKIKAPSENAAALLTQTSELRACYAKAVFGEAPPSAFSNRVPRDTSTI
jgi:hypothetical protein